MVSNVHCQRVGCEPVNADKDTRFAYSGGIQTVVRILFPNLINSDSQKPRVFNSPPTLYGIQQCLS